MAAILFNTPKLIQLDVLNSLSLLRGKVAFVDQELWDRKEISVTKPRGCRRATSNPIGEREEWFLAEIDAEMECGSVPQEMAMFPAGGSEAGLRQHTRPACGCIRRLSG